MKPTFAWASQTLIAVNKLIEQYENETHEERNIDKCPLCVTANMFQVEYEPSCDYCPWIVFRKRTCDGIEAVDYILDPISLRLRRLNGWKIKLKNIITKEK